MTAPDIELFKECLAVCGNGDYFERDIELAIQRNLKIFPLDISDLNCIEGDFVDDLDRANKFLADAKNG